jgi:sigma-B regulation protein RsbU (phosphoserine phosphatase)
MFITLFAGILDLKTGMLHYCNAGHDPAIIINNDVQYLSVIPNLPIGIMPDFEYQAQEIKLKSDETLFLYTDGVTEAENAAHELYGTTRLLECIRNHKGNSVRLFIEDVLKDVACHVQNHEPSDDLTMLAIRQLPQEKEPVSKQIIFESKLSEITILQQFIEEFCHENNIAPKLTMQLNLALEEVVSNIILYAYPESEVGKIELTAEVKNHALTFTLTDYGILFDPTQQPYPDITSSIEERPIGGLGIFLARQIMDEIKYERLENRNRLILIIHN